MRTLFDGCTCSNGLDWYGDTMVYCDSLEHRVERFRFVDGAVTERRTVLAILQDLCDLIITTAAQGQNMDEQPQAGDVFRVRCDVPGYPTRRYKG